MMGYGFQILYLSIYRKRLSGRLKRPRSIMVPFTTSDTLAPVFLLNNGLPIEIVSKILGHKSIQTTQVYARVKRETVKEAMKVFNAR